MSRAVVRIEPARQEHVDGLKGRLRAQDRDEVLAACGLPPDAALQRAFADSVLAWAAVRGDRPLAVFGAGRGTAPGTGSPWLLGTDALDGAGRDFALHSKVYVGHMLARFSRLENWVDARNTRSVRWLAWCGFRVGAARPFGPFRLPFHPFEAGGAGCVFPC